MKRTFLLFTIAAAFAVLTLNSNSSGPANNNNGNRTGGPGSSGTCISCHTGASGTTGAVSLKKKADNTPANGQYTPGETYTVTVTGNHPTLSKFGFQLMALKNSDNKQAGSFGNLGTNHHSKVISGITLIEHHHTLSKTGTEFKAEFEWTAPAAGTGNVKFYGALNAVDGTGTTSSDAGSPGFELTLAESTNGINTIVSPELVVYPNPVKQALHIKVTDNGTYTVKAFSMDGKLAIKEQVEVTDNTINLPVDLVTGTYMLELSHGTKQLIIPFIKD